MIRIRSIFYALILATFVFGCGDDPTTSQNLCAPCLRSAGAECPGSNCGAILINCFGSKFPNGFNLLREIGILRRFGIHCYRLRDPNNLAMAQAFLQLKTPRDEPNWGICPIHSTSLAEERQNADRDASSLSQLDQFFSEHGLVRQTEDEYEAFCRGISEPAQRPFLTLMQTLYSSLPSNQQAARQAGCFADPTPGPQSTGVIDGNGIAESINAAAVMLGGPGAFDPARPRPVANRNTSSNSATAMTRPPNGVGGGSPPGSGPTSGSGTPPTGFSMPTPTLADGSSGGGSSNTTDSGLNASLPSDGKKTDDPVAEEPSEQLAAVDNTSSFGAASQGSGRGGAGGSNPLSGMSDLLGSLTGKKGDGDQSNGSASNVNFGTRGPAAAPGATDPEVYLQRNSKLNLFEIIHERMQRF